MTKYSVSIYAYEEYEADSKEEAEQMARNDFTGFALNACDFSFSASKEGD